jgi:hypothetical protein
MTARRRRRRRRRKRTTPQLRNVLALALDVALFLERQTVFFNKTVQSNKNQRQQSRPLRILVPAGDSSLLFSLLLFSALGKNVTNVTGENTNGP